MKIYVLKRKSIPKVAVLATGLAAALLAAAFAPQAAQAFPSYQSDCTNCHGAAGDPARLQLNFLGTPIMAPSTDYAIQLNMNAIVNSGQSSWWIANSDAAGTTGTTAAICRTSSTPAPAAPLCYGLPALSQSFFPRLTAPAAAGTYYYKVFMVHGIPSAQETYTTTFSITVTAPVTTTPPVTTTTTTPPVTTTTTTPPVTTTTTTPPVTTTTTTPPVTTTTTTPPVTTTTTTPPVTTTTTTPPVTTTTPPVTTTTPPVTTTTPPVTSTTTTPPATSTTTTPPVTTTTTTTPPVIAAPGAPTGVTVVPGNGQAVVSWTPSVSGGAATSYTVTASPGGMSVTTTGTTATVTGLTNGVSYSFTVTATNSAGTAVSVASAAVTPVAAAAGVVPAGAPATGAGGAAQSTDSPLVGFGGLALLLSGAAMVTVIRRRRQV